MAAIKLEDAKTRLEAWLAADLAVSQGQSYEVDTGGTRRKLSRVDAAEIRTQINYWAGWVNRLERGKSGPVIRLAVPRD